MTAAPVGAPEPAATRRRLPPVAELAAASIALMMAGGILQASQLPGRVALAAPLALVAVGGALTVAALTLLARIRPFAWSSFFLVLRWALVAYGVIAAVLLYVFALGHPPAGTMALLVVTVLIFAVDVPTILAFTVARYAGS